MGFAIFPEGSRQKWKVEKSKLENGMRTDAREASYWILSSLLTAECSTVELPGIIPIL